MGPIHICHFEILCLILKKIQAAVFAELCAVFDGLLQGSREGAEAGREDGLGSLSGTAANIRKQVVAGIPVTQHRPQL